MKFLKFVASAVALCAVFSARPAPSTRSRKTAKILIATEGQFAPVQLLQRHDAHRASRSNWPSWWPKDGRDRAMEDAGL